MNHHLPLLTCHYSSFWARIRMDHRWCAPLSWRRSAGPAKISATTGVTKLEISVVWISAGLCWSYVDHIIYYNYYVAILTMYSYNYYIVINNNVVWLLFFGGSGWVHALAAAVVGCLMVVCWFSPAVAHQMGGLEFAWGLRDPRLSCAVLGWLIHIDWYLWLIVYVHSLGGNGSGNVGNVKLQYVMNLKWSFWNKKLGWFQSDSKVGHVHFECFSRKLKTSQMAKHN